MEFARGSEWRRWDLHIHTPGTKKNDNYTGTDNEKKWDNFYKKIEAYVGDGTDPCKNIAVIGITDYLSVENYFRVIRERDRLPKSVKLILPNVELRITPIAKDCPVNIHCIFSPELLEDQINTSFFGQLDFQYKGMNYHATKSDLIRLGKAYSNQKSLSDSEAYEIGINQFVISLGQLEALFSKDSNLRENTIIVVSNNDNDGASGVSKHKGYGIEGGYPQLGATRERIYQISDLIFTGNPKDRAYFLGVGADSVEKLKERYGAVKGCIHGSDAHSLGR